ncbi:MAG: porin family protein [Kiritimatiellaeota bacterium]|nr:porin family protein [Kiritimatiellota bacterium]
MRKLFIVLLLALCFPLFAQQTPESAIYIPYVDGSGSGVEDNSYFTHLLEMETEARNYRAVRNPAEANYSLVGRINPYGTGDFVFQLELVNNKNDSIIVQQEIIYHYYTEVHSLFPILMLTMFSNIPERPREEPSPMLFVAQRPQDHWLVLGAYGFWSPRIYSANGTSVSFLNFGAGLSAEGHFLDFLSLEAGVEITNDWLLIAGRSNDEYHDFILETPVFIKYVYNPSGNYFIGPFAGIKTTVSLRGATKPSLFSWLAGLQYGVRIGPGFVFVEARYSADLGNSRAKIGFSDQEYKRYMLNLGVGYKYGFFPRERK